MSTQLWIVAMLSILSAAAYAFELDGSAAREGDWGYRPAEGARVRRNPPGFTWRPTRGATAYTLEVATDSGFDAVVYRCEATPWSAHCPSEFLPPGTYFWRYAASDQSGARTAWSKTRTFAIPPEAVAFPRPAVAALTERMPEGHPRLFFRPEDILRLRAAADAELAGQWAKLRARADALLADPPDSSEPPLYPEGMKSRDDKWMRIWWGNRTRVIAVADGAATLAFVYSVSGDERYARAARDLLLAMCEWDPDGSTAYTYNDEAAMPALYMTSRAYDWAYAALSREDRDRIAAMMRTRGQQTFNYLRKRRHLWRPYASHSNRAWHFLGEVAVAFYGEIPEAETWLDYAMTVFYTAYPAWSASDGGWHEGVSYWASYIRRFMYWADVMRAAFGIDVFERPFFRRTGYYGMYILPPGTRHGGFADMAPTAKARRIAPVMALLAVGAQNPHWLWHAEQAGFRGLDGYLGFLFAWRGTGLESQPPAQLPSSICFRGVGIASLNTNVLDGTRNVQLLFKSSPMGSISHGFNANNAFHLNVRGRPMLVNTGRRDLHGTPHHREWMWQTRSQNAILVNGKGQRSHSPHAKGRIIEFETSPEVDVVVGEAGDSYDDLDRWTRRIVFFKPHVFVIHDVLEAPAPSTYQWLLHAPGAFAVEGARARYESEGAAVSVQFLVPQSLSISQHDRYDPPPADWARFKIHEWHLTAETVEKARQAEFLTLIRVDDAPVSWDLSGEIGERRLTLKFDAEEACPPGRATLRLARDTFSVTYRDSEKNGSDRP